MKAVRGFVPEDERNFSPDALLTLKEASRHVRYLLNKGYGARQAVTFVGNHFLLSKRQRLAIMRSVSSDKEREDRLSRLVPPDELAGRRVFIDGFNEIITLEIMVCHSLLLECMDGAIRDLASLRGTYRLIPETRQAVDLLLSSLCENGIRDAVILLDEPVSNSGRLKSLIADRAEAFTVSRGEIRPDIRICRDVDRQLYGRENIVTADSVILDHCRSWINLSRCCLKRAGASVIRVW